MFQAQSWHTATTTSIYICSANKWTLAIAVTECISNITTFIGARLLSPDVRSRAFGRSIGNTNAGTIETSEPDTVVSSN
jgi:hypothetical protein